MNDKLPKLDRAVPESCQKLIDDSLSNGLFELNKASTPSWKKLRFTNFGIHFHGNQTATTAVETALSGDLLIDLGGDNGSPKIAEQYAVETYVNVDRCLWLKTSTGRSEFKKEDLTAPYPLRTEEITPNCTQYDMQRDVLDYVCQLPDNAANFMINGIDDAIIPSYNYPGYHELLAKEITRATKPGGVVFGTCSSVLEILGQQPEMIDLTPDEMSLGNKCYTKR